MTFAHNRGLTLVEVLVALVVMGLLSLLAYRALDSTVRVRDRVSLETGRWRELSFFFDKLRDDLDQPVFRGPRNAAGERLPVWRGSGSSFEMSTIGQGANPLRRIQYRWNAGTVELLLWPAFDLAPGAVAEAHPLVGEVSSLRFSYLSHSKAWIETWPPKSGDTESPLAIRVDLALSDGAHVSRIFALP